MLIPIKIKLLTSFASSLHVECEYEKTKSSTIILSLNQIKLSTR